MFEVGQKVKVVATAPGHTDDLLGYTGVISRVTPWNTIRVQLDNDPNPHDLLHYYGYSFKAEELEAL